MSKRFDFLILGATGLTGRQATRFLAAHPDRSKKWTLAIAARSKQKLDKMASELSLPQDVKIVTVDVTDEEAVNNLVKQTRVVLNTVGPFAKWGTPVVKACVRNGVHHVDLSGETQWMKEVIIECDYNASKTGSIIVSACGFDSIPSDLSLYVANKTLKNIDDSLQVATSTTAFSISGIISNGTLSSMIFARSMPRHRAKELGRPYYLSPVVGPSSSKRRAVYSVYVPQMLKTIVGGFFFMSPTNKAVVQRSWGLLEQDAIEHPSPKAQKSRYGPLAVYEEFLATGGTISAIFLSVLTGLFWASLGVPPIRWLLQKIVPGDTGITDQQLERGYFKTINVTTSTPTASHPDGVKVTTTMSGKGDPGYLLSPILMAECALALLDIDLLPVLAKRGGVLTPATACGDSLVKRLQANERFDLRVEVDDGKNESRKSV